MLIGEYKASNELVLEITKEPVDGKVEGVFSNPNPGHNWSCAVSGVFQPWDTNHNRILLSMSGLFRHQVDTSGEPAVRYEVISVFGYAEASDGTSPVNRLTLIQGWANDGSHNQETVGSQSAVAFTRQ